MFVGGKYLGNSDPELGQREEAPQSDSGKGDNGSESSMSQFDEMEDSTMSDLQSRAAKETRKNLAKKETRFVVCLRYFVLLVLLGTAVGVSVSTYFYSRGVENDSFTAEFDSVAVTTLRSFVEAIEHSFGSLDAVSSSITSHALSTGETFPNVTVPDFEVKGAIARTQTGSIFMFYLPKVTDETRAGYEEYTKQIQSQQQLFGSYAVEEGLRQYQDAHFGINASETQAAIAAEHAAQAEAEAAAAEEELAREEIEEGEDQEGRKRKLQVAAVKHKLHRHGLEEARRLHVAPPDPQNPMPPLGHMFIHDQIWGLNSLNFTDNDSWYQPQNSGPYLPTWQMSPTIPLPAIINFDFLDYTDLAPALNTTLNTGKVALSYIQTEHEGSDTEDLIQVFLTLNQYRHRFVDYNADPMTQVNYPVYDSFNPLEKKTSGVILSAIFWRLLLLDILPESVKGVVCVLKNSLGDAVTYQIDGREASYLGKGDLHDPKYNDMGVSRDISEYIAERARVETSSYTTVELDNSYLQYEIFVYPSQIMEDTYITSDPVLYAIIVAFIFVFTSMVFIVYDWCVERRQKKVMGVAVRSTAVVTSLFPKAVHERLFAEKEDETSNHGKDPWMAQNGTGNNERRNSRNGSIMGPLSEEDDRSMNQSSAHMSIGGGIDASGHEALNPRKKKKKKGVIADKYPAVTIFFADLAGFTKWSSTREPEQVFELLEALYGAFDKIALRRVVFKVETIGDCYMAVTGIPNAQPDHATRMVKFARDCMMRMDRILNDLQHTLGADTVELSMRTGLHSGPVTAGVLRGDKGRFQLFGDTVNTASRMESNGVKRRIHCSQATADLLPSKWLTAREDKIVAKGKGEMQTYFVDASMEAKSCQSAFSMFDDGNDSIPHLAASPPPSRLVSPDHDSKGSIVSDFSEAEPVSDVFMNETMLGPDGESEREPDLFAMNDNISDIGQDDVKDLSNNNIFKDDSSSRPAERFRNEESERAPAIFPVSRFSRFGDSIAKALKLADEISV